MTGEPNIVRTTELLRAFENPTALDDYIARLTAEPKPPLLYHYTSVAGLEGILRSGAFWISDAFNLNDDTEVRYGVDAACKFLSEAAAQAGAPNVLKDFADTVCRRLREDIETVANFFVCSFTSHADHLGQWDKYADGRTGYALGMDTASLEQHFMSVAPDCHHTFPVSYDGAEMLRIQRAIVDQAIEILRSAGPKPSVELLRSLSILFSVHVIQCAALFKSSGWQEENEYRFLMVRGNDVPVPNERTRFRGDAVLRYWEYEWRSGCADSLREMVVGPNADVRLAEDLITRLLPEHRVGIRRSTIAST